MCESAPTSSSNKKCTLKDGKSGCQESQEIEIEIEKDTSAKASTNEITNDKNGSKIYKTNLFVIISILFILL